MGKFWGKLVYLNLLHHLFGGGTSIHTHDFGVRQVFDIFDPYPDKI